MIDRKQLRKLHDQNLPLHVLEQDYIQALFLQKLYSQTEGLVFKGGTFLKHAHGLDRFSEDLDFTKKRKFEDVVPVLKQAANSLSDYGVEAEVDNIQENNISTSYKLRYQGPLYDGSKHSKGNIEIDVSKREDVLTEPEWTRLFFEYPEIRVVNALGLSREELLAEKLRALSTRDKARDLYDCWYLINQGIEPKKDLFEKKMEVVGEEPVLNISITEEEWESDLNIFLENPPALDDVREQLASGLQESGFNLDIK
jgi:predicted nucleotidyltransferase component of viral defense system